MSRRFGLLKAVAAGTSTALGMHLAANGPSAHAKALQSRDDDANSLRLRQPPGNAAGMLDVWMGACPRTGGGDATLCQRQKDPALCMQWFDRSSPWQRSIRSAANEWSHLISHAVAGKMDTWMLPGRRAVEDGDEQARRVLGLVVLLDQVPRILHSDARKFVGDARALQLANAPVDDGLHLRLPASQRLWLFFPMLHSESLSDQQRATLLFKELVEEHAEFSVIMPSVHAHREAVARFGRLPERNALLGRQTTAAERDFLQEHPTC